MENSKKSMNSKIHEIDSSKVEDLTSLDLGSDDSGEKIYKFF